MLEQYRTIYEGGQGEITEKKSRFIATVRLVKTEEEAVKFIEEMKKKYCLSFIFTTPFITPICR